MTKLWRLPANDSAAARFSIRLFNRQGMLPPLTAAVLSASYLIRTLLGWPSPSESLSPVTDEQSAAADAGTVPDYLEIADWHLFGHDDTVERETADVLVETPLQLKLLGTFLLSGRTDGRYAIIQSADGTQQKYREGESLPEDAVLQRVEKSRVVLKHSQRLESLAFAPNPVTLAAPEQ